MTDLQSFCFVLTVAEGKRLIAKAVAALPVVQQARQQGLIAVCKGTTNSYVAEELLGRTIDKGSYVLGRTVPAKAAADEVFAGEMAEVILADGRPVTMTLREALEQMQTGDVVIKGANALNYENGVAGVLVGHRAGGTVGTIIGSVYGKGLHLIIPVGLEKETSSDITEISVLINEDPSLTRPGFPALWPLQGEIITELEALELLTGCEACQVAAGGVCGAEGAIWLGVWGSAGQIAAARQLIEGLQGEAAFGLSCGEWHQ
jgi:hypothetical protein